MNNIDFKKGDGLVPVIIQDDRTLQVLMLGYMNAEAYEKSKSEMKVTFFSRSKNRLWTKGETSGNFLFIKSIKEDCDNDSLLISAVSAGPTCHTGMYSCFAAKANKGFVYELEKTIQQRIDEKQTDSYTYNLFTKGINKVVQKVGEEAVELVIEAKDNNEELFKDEAADLLYHYLILLKTKQTSLEEIEKVLIKRSK